ncbi:UNVERIFIED_CONTAM: Pentatricopeptide repeat-containing protein [Sesamum calycinum]|uniref:Pentatricopeptide repeat-containing protein n=1 Tax=Sesamum calycinum TaxID=2727403 RepID=A0AAW2N386_9LAMI
MSQHENSQSNPRPHSHTSAPPSVDAVVCTLQSPLLCGLPQCSVREGAAFSNSEVGSEEVSRYQNTFTLAFVLKCSLLPAFEEGKQVHKHVIASGLGENLFVRTSLLNFYTKCEEVELGREVFDEMTEKNVVAWSAMIGGYAKVGMVNEAFGLFREMQKGGVNPDEVTMVSVISACAATGALDFGEVAANIH